jgi:hypothetical protein
MVWSIGAEMAEAADAAVSKTAARKGVGVRIPLSAPMTLKQLLDAGAEADQDVKNVVGGLLIATVKDADGNTIGVRQST